MADEIRKIRVLIINHNGEEFLPACLESLSRQTLQDFSVTLVDNDSEDDSVVVARKNYEGIEVIANRKNLGFATGVNQGAVKCLEEYFAVITSDTIVYPTWLDELVKAIEKGDNIFSVSACQLFLANRNRVKSAGLGYTPGGIAYNISYKKLYKKVKLKKVFATALVGSLFNKRAFVSIDGLDDNYFTLYEDIDVCWRARKKGYSCASQLNATFYRMGESSLIDKETRYRLQIRNSEWTYHKNLPIRHMIVFSLAHGLALARKKRFIRRKKCVKSYYQGLAEGRETFFINRTKIKKSFFKDIKIFYMMIGFGIKRIFSINKEEF
ncbi:glycosyltransferase family 2 protein [Treponema sp. R6D11]